MGEEIETRCAAADEQPGDVRLQIEAAYACDREGEEERAIVYYDRAWSLGVAEDEVRGFLVGYGSTLRNVSRAQDALSILAEGVKRYPSYVPLRMFLSLTLLDASRDREASLHLLEVLVEHDEMLDGFGRALSWYVDQVR